MALDLFSSNHITFIIFVQLSLKYKHIFGKKLSTVLWGGSIALWDRVVYNRGKWDKVG